MYNIDNGRPLYTLTVGEYIELQKAIFDQKQQQTQNPEGKDDQMINSIRGLAGFLHCSVPTAQQFKNKFPEIFYQIGRKFLVSKIDILSKMKLA